MPAQGHRSARTYTRRSTFATFEHRDGVLTAGLAGPNISEREAYVLGRELEATLERLDGSLRTLVLDLRHVRCMSSMGLGMCIDARHLARRLGARTVVFGLSPQLAELFRMTKVDRLYKIAGTPAELERLTAA